MLQASMLTESPASSSPFCFRDHPIRTRIDNDQLWFVAKDVCAALDISLSGVTFRGFPKDWQGMMKFITPSGNQPFKVITEPAVYKLAFRSNKPEADAFTNWVASEVIPAIRNTGKFESPAAQPALPDTSPLTQSSRAELKAIVDAKLSTYPSDVQGKARSEIWTRFNRHFKIAEYAQLPMCQMPDARDYLVEMKPKALATIEAKPEKALCSVRPDSTIMDDIRAFADEVEQARQKNIEMQQHLFNLISKLMARIGIQYIGKYDTPDAVGFAVNGVYYVRESCRQAVMETHRPMSFCEPAALMAEFAGMIGGEYKKAAKQYTGVM